MGALRFLLWTGLCVGAGIAMASVEVGGRTPVSHLERLWRHQAPRLEKVKEAGVEVVDEVKRKVASAPAEPKESHGKADRAAVDEIISRRQKTAAP